MLLISSLKQLKNLVFFMVLREKFGHRCRTAGQELAGRARPRWGLGRSRQGVHVPT